MMTTAMDTKLSGDYEKNAVNSLTIRYSMIIINASGSDEE